VTEEEFRLGLGLSDQVDLKYKPVWIGLTPHDRAALALYFLPHSRKTRKQAQDESAKEKTLTPTRPRVVKWYCPFACQSESPTGHRYCINVYTGCAHKCMYCYAASYVREGEHIKHRFKTGVDRDMADLEHCDVPPGPVHLSNSTDPFQPMEEEHGHTRYVLEQILAHRKRFTTVTILTKNPGLPVAQGDIDLFKALLSLPPDHPRATELHKAGSPGFVVEVSLAFWREEARMAFEPCAPSVASRVEAIRSLRAAGIPVVIRIDPLFPRSALPSGVSLGRFGLPEAQTLADLEHLVAFAAEVQAQHVVYSAVKVCKPLGRTLSGPMLAVKNAYTAMAAPNKVDFHGGSWRLPWSAAGRYPVPPASAGACPSCNRGSPRPRRTAGSAGRCSRAVCVSRRR
jgi:DNA repair photolyase